MECASASGANTNKRKIEFDDRQSKRIAINAITAKFEELYANTKWSDFNDVDDESLQPSNIKDIEVNDRVNLISNKQKLSAFYHVLHNLKKNVNDKIFEKFIEDFIADIKLSANNVAIKIIYDNDKSTDILDDKDCFSYDINVLFDHINNNVNIINNCKISNDYCTSLYNIMQLIFLQCVTDNMYDDEGNAMNVNEYCNNVYIECKLIAKELIFFLHNLQ